MAREALQEAVDVVGGQSELGRLIGVKQQRISKWLLLSKDEVPPAEFVRAIVEASCSKGGSVTAHDLRPDLYPEGFTFPRKMLDDAREATA